MSMDRPILIDLFVCGYAFRPDNAYPPGETTLAASATENKEIAVSVQDLGRQPIGRKNHRLDKAGRRHSNGS